MVIVRTRRRRLVIALLLAAAGGYAAYMAWIRNDPPELTRVAEARSGQIIVGRNVHVSAALPLVNHDGCTIAADPSDARRLFAASMHWHTPSETGVVGYRSNDGGATWRTGVERLGRRPRERLCDEALAFAPDGGLYLAHMRGMPDENHTGASTEFLYSADGGETWEVRGRIDAFIDRPQLAADCTTGPSRGRLYCNANDNRPRFFASHDGTRTLQPAKLPDPGLVTVYPSNPAVLSDGTVVIAYRRSGGNAAEPPAIPVWRSTDGGRTFTAATPVPTAWRHPRARPSSGFVIYPLLAADPGSPSFAGRLFCIWADGSRSDERYVLVSASGDGGATWSVPQVLSEQPLAPDATADWQAEIPAVAVNKDGIVAVCWYDRRGLPKATKRPDGSIVSAGYNLRLRASTDGGKTWLPSVQVNDAAGQGDLLDVRYWIGMAADAEGKFHPAWVSDATGVRQLWTATVGVTR